MSIATTMFDLDKHGEDQLLTAVRRLPPGAMLILAGSGYGISAMAGGARRFHVRVPPKVTERPDINHDAFKAVATAVPELVRVHKQFMEEQQPNEE